MACGGAMALRPVEIPTTGWLDDRRVELGQADEERGYKEGRHLDFLAGAFSATDGDGKKRVFYIAKYEATRDQYAVVKGEGCPRPSMRGRLPVTDISWFDAVEFSRRYTEWLLKHAREQLPVEGLEPGFLRLPTEVEWEFAGRGGPKVDEADFLSPLFPMPEGGLAQYAWHESTQSAEGRLHPVGLLQPNPLGLHDVLGNAAEMTLLPFQLDHRGRPHGQAGGFATRGGVRPDTLSGVTSWVRDLPISGELVGAGRSSAYAGPTGETGVAARAAREEGYQLTTPERRMREQSRNFERTVWEGALIGAAGGALWGIIKRDETSDVLKKAAIGAAVGGLAGAYIAHK
jgi:formylglycine-generating enzyme required for sulfatase activity